MVSGATAGLGGALLGLLVALRLQDGSYAALVQRWYGPVLGASAVVLLALAALVALQTMRNRGTWRANVTPGAAAMVALAGLPIVLGFAYKPAPLTSDSLETLSDGGRSSLQFSTTAAGSPAATRNVYQWAYEFATADPGTLLGDSVDVIGFVYHGDAPQADRFEVARFVVACCVADARGFTLPVRWAGSADLERDSWVRVQGRVGTDPDGALVILAGTVETIGTPANPYIYP